MHLPVALLPQIPEAFVMHLLVFRRADEAPGGFRLVDRSVATDLGAPRLGLGSRPQRLRRALGVIEAATISDDGIGIVLGPQLGMQHGAAAVDWLRYSGHAPAPFRIWAMWMNFIGTPMRSAHPC